MNQITDLAAAIVTLAIITTLVSNKETADIVNAVGKAFSGSLRAAMGR